MRCDFYATKQGTSKFLSYQELTSKQLLSATGSSAQLTVSDNQCKKRSTRQLLAAISCLTEMCPHGLLTPCVPINIMTTLTFTVFLHRSGIE